VPPGRCISESFIYTLNAEEILYIHIMPDAFVAFCYFLAGSLIKLERSVEGTEIWPDDAWINLKRSME